MNNNAHQRHKMKNLNNNQHGYHNEDPNRHISHSPQKEFVYWHAPRSSFPVPPPPTSSSYVSAPSGALAMPSRNSNSNRLKDEGILVEQLPSPIASSVPIRKSTIRPKMGLGSRSGFIVSTPKEAAADFSQRGSSPRKVGHAHLGEDLKNVVRLPEEEAKNKTKTTKKTTLPEEEEDDEPIYCEITRGDNSPPAKTPPSIIKHHRQQQQQQQPPVQRRNHPTTKRTAYKSNKHIEDETSPTKPKKVWSSMNAKPRDPEKRLARDFSQLQLIPPASRGLPLSEEFRPERANNRQRRISCDLSSQVSNFGGLPSMAPNLPGPTAFYQVAPGGRSVLGLGRRAVTQVDIPVSTRNHLPPPPHLVRHQRPGALGPPAFEPAHLMHGHPTSSISMTSPTAHGVGGPLYTVRKHQQIRSSSTAAVAVKRSRQLPSGHHGSSSSSSSVPMGGCGAFSDSEYSRRPMPSSPAMGSRKPLLLHQALHGGECPSESGFNSGLDETNSTTTTTTTATDSGTRGSTNMAITYATALRKGLLWQQRDKIFSRWKERFFILTPDYLQCFKKGSSRMTEMGGFIFKLKLAEIEEVELVDKKGYLTVALSFHKEGRMLLRKPEGIREWFQSIKNCVDVCREKRGMMKTAKEFWSKKQFTDSSSMEQYILARKRIELKFAYGEAESCTSGSKLSNINDQSYQLRDLARSHLNVAQRNVPISATSNLTTTTTGSNTTGLATNTSTTTTTTNYGFIDLPSSHPNWTDCCPSPDLPPSSHLVDELESRYSVSPTSSSTGFRLKQIARDTSSTFSHDSGVDSMNTISSGSALSNQVPSYSSSANKPSNLNSSAETCSSPKNIRTPRKSRIPRHKPVKGARPNREEMLRNISLV
ncbi:uncharacterized protein LOC131883662 isoform X2 [Tigriopus californicus]|uniref:uncharacterized protein LOC131883662 isoform X2 n=1 Tax=Tigriopus californicus TaxID=6832 RepID=UPI0027DA835D|nr:uncharacterized protein LOC131883662 isoform X2 [Tigriopus californicus]